jgi:hypothetical protein
VKLTRAESARRYRARLRGEDVPRKKADPPDGVVWHQLSEVDQTTGIGTCSVCGPVTRTFRTGGRNRRCSKAAVDAHYRWRRGMSKEDFAALVDAQDGVCANPRCQEPATVMDHDHGSGRNRQPLCGPCNRALGHACENRERLLGLAEYLDRHLKAAGARTAIWGLY